MRRSRVRPRVTMAPPREPLPPGVSCLVRRRWSRRDSAGAKMLIGANIKKTLISMLLAPAMGFIVAYFFYVALIWMTVKWRPSTCIPTGRPDSGSTPAGMEMAGLP